MKLNDKKILVVDDTEATRYAIARTLKAEGYTVVEAGTGTQALELIETAAPDLVTLDIHLPDMMGFDVCKKIKANPVTAHIPVLQVSASYVTSKDRIHGLEGGADSYLTHPCEPAVLLATIKALLRSRQLTSDLKLAEEKFRVALKYAPIMIYTTDRNLNFTWLYNTPAGIDPAEYLDKPFQNLMSSDDSAHLLDLKKSVLETGIGGRITIQLMMAQVPQWYDMTIEPLRGSNEQITGLTVACINVTERLQSEEDQRQAYKLAEMANVAKTRFLSNMSHEIRTPLGVIQGFADLALDPAASSTDRSSFLTTIKRNAHNLTKLLGEILDLAKVESGKIEIEKMKFSLPDLLNELVEAHSLHAREKGVSLRLDFQGPFPENVVTDSTRLRQILVNLINNALKFTDRGGVEIIAQALPVGEKPAPVTIEIKVRDTGIGLTPEQQERLFEAFMQADSSTTRKFGGTGLGLNLSKKLAQALGGDLVLSQSIAGKGSTFTLHFDAGNLSQADFADRFRVREKEDSVLAPTKFDQELQGMNILVAEDSVDNQILFSLYLKNAGALVEIANDGLQALEKTKKTTYDAILMDVQMPNVDGYEATRTLRDRGDLSPIIALTAHALTGDRERALALGFTSYLTKPLNPKKLVETLLPFRKA